MAIEYTKDSYTFAKNINGVKKLKTISRINPEKLGALTMGGGMSTVRATVEPLVNAMIGVTAGDTVPVSETEVMGGGQYRFRVTRTLPVDYDVD